MSNQPKQGAHTPGPWSRNIKPASKYNTIFAGRNTHVAHLAAIGLSESEIEANCSLIAAAPELLEALKALEQEIVNLVDDGDGTLGKEALTHPSMLKARAAIKAATLSQEV